MQFAYLQRDATRLSVHQTTLLTSQRVASFANTGRMRRGGARDEADKAESEAAVTEGEGGGGGQQVKQTTKSSLHMQKVLSKAAAHDVSLFY